MILRNEAPEFARRVLLDARPGAVHARVTDNVHDFVVVVHHDGHRVTSVTGEAPRFPWSTCPGAIAMLDRLVGTPIAIDARPDVDQRQQCTHMFDLARLAIAQGARGGERLYAMQVHRREDPDTAIATIHRDGVPYLEWQIKGDVVVAPDAFAGHDLRGRSRWSAEVLADPDLVEAALVLRRCVFIYRSRPFSKHMRRASDMPSMEGVCFSFQPGRSSQAVRPPGFVELD